MWAPHQQRLLQAMGLTPLRVQRPGASLAWDEAPLSPALRAAIQRVAGERAAGLTVPPALRGAPLKRALWQQLRGLRRDR
jgi:hypothetical protein